MHNKNWQPIWISKCAVFFALGGLLFPPTQKQYVRENVKPSRVKTSSTKLFKTCYTGGSDNINNQRAVSIHKPVLFDAL